jgi:polyisoprenoid-binding protein YceI
MRFLWLMLPFLLIASTAWSDQVSLRPPGAAVELRTYGFGVIPFDGTFTRFQGWMRYTPANTDMCQVMLEIEAASLTMENAAIRDRIVAADMMDVVRFPGLTFEGVCKGAAVTGDLTMHGQTHTVTLDFTRSGGKVTATGHLRRADWGISGSPMSGGPLIRIRVVLPDPFLAPHT